MSDTRSQLQFRLRTLFMLTAVVAIIFAGYAMWDRAMHSFFHDAFVGDTGPITSKEDWPKPLKELAQETDAIGLDVSTIQVHCLCQGFDPEYVWRMHAAPGLMDHLKTRWQLTEVTNPNWQVLTKRRSHNSGVPTPSWWSPKKDASTSFFACPQTIAGEKGDRFCIAHDGRNEKIYVHYWFNF